MPWPRLTSLSHLPYELKRFIARECGLNPLDLLTLSHCNREWRDIAIEDDAFATWYQSFPASLRREIEGYAPGGAEGELVNVKLTKRMLVMLACRKTCIKCKAETLLISLVFQRRICGVCLVTCPEFVLAPITVLHEMFHIKPSQTKKLIVLKKLATVMNGRKFSAVHMASIEEVKKIAMKKHGGSMTTLHAHLIAQKNRVRAQYERKLAAWEMGRRSGDDNAPKTKPHLPYILKDFKIRYELNERSTIELGALEFNALSGEAEFVNSIMCRICTNLPQAVILAPSKHKREVMESIFARLALSAPLLPSSTSTSKHTPPPRTLPVDIDIDSFTFALKTSYYDSTDDLASSQAWRQHVREWHVEHLNKTDCLGECLASRLYWNSETGRGGVRDNGWCLRCVEERAMVECLGARCGGCGDWHV